MLLVFHYYRPKRLTTATEPDLHRSGTMHTAVPDTAQAPDARGLSTLLGGLNIQGQRPGAKYNGLKSNMPLAVPSYNPLVLLPNGAIFGGLPYDQNPYLPPTGIYPGLASPCPVVPSPAGDFYHGATPNLEGPGLPNYGYNSFPQPAPACLPFQMMKTPTGYILQDLESLTQQDPPIPRAVPAMWTNPSELTLAKCLENREGITNVYIRGFLPETTDEMLHAYASRFGKIDRCKAIVDLDTGLCKGYARVWVHGLMIHMLTAPIDSDLSSTITSNLARTASVGSSILATRLALLRYIFRAASLRTIESNKVQKSRNSRLKDLEDKTSTNIYCTNIPIEWTEAVSKKVQ